jgi:sugar lactone lactonase YvrE
MVFPASFIYSKCRDILSCTFNDTYSTASRSIVNSKGTFMQLPRVRLIKLVYLHLLVVGLLLTACNQSSTAISATPTRVVSPTQSIHVPVTSDSTPTSQPTTVVHPTVPTHYTSHIILKGVGRPDDLAFDQNGHLLFSDEFNDSISRINADGTVSLVLKDANGPEGLVVLPDGTIIFAEQETNRIVSLAPGSHTPTLLHTLPGVNSTAHCKAGVDGIALDAKTQTLIVPDSPTGDVYRMSLDGQMFTKLVSGIVRPVGASIDSQGNIFIADECGNAIWSITATGSATRIGGFGMPDDILPDGYGNVLLIDLDPAIHALIRLNLATGNRETLASQGYIEPQGLAMDKQNDIFVSDDYANMIVEYTPEYS